MMDRVNDCLLRQGSFSLFPASNLHSFVKMARDFPGGPMIENPPCNAGDSDSIPVRETAILHATEQLIIPCASATEPANHRLESMHLKERSCVAE